MKNYLKALLIAIVSIFTLTPKTAEARKNPPIGTTLTTYYNELIIYSNGCYGHVHNTIYWSSDNYGYHILEVDYSLTVMCDGVVVETFTFTGIPTLAPDEHTVTSITGINFADPSGNPYPQGQTWVSTNQVWLVNSANNHTDAVNNP